MTKEQRREYDRRAHELAKPAYDALMSCYPFTLENLDGEGWKDIAGFEGYQVSTFGRVKSFWRKSPRILKPQLLGEYLSVNLYIDGEMKHHLVHILVAKAFIPNPMNKPEVNHDDGNKFNCHVSNLYWSTLSENQQHATRTGLNKSGTEHYKAKYTLEQILYIRENPDNLTTYELAKIFNTNNGEISWIQLGKIYANAGGNIRGKIVRRIADEIRNQIRADWATGKYSQRELARKFGCSRPTVRKIIREGLIIQATP